MVTDISWYSWKKHVQHTIRTLLLALLKYFADCERLYYKRRVRGGSYYII